MQPGNAASEAGAEAAPVGERKGSMLGCMSDDSACSAEEGCDAPVRARGLCVKHYNRWRRHGDANVVKKRGIQPEVVAARARDQYADRDGDQLVTLAEWAAIIGSSTAQLGQWKVHRPDFPEAVYKPGQGKGPNLYRLADLAEHAMPRRRRASEPVSERERMIAAAYQGGMSRRKVAAAHGVTEHVVQDALNRVGVPVRSRAEAQALRRGHPYVPDDDRLRRQRELRAATRRRQREATGP